MCKSKEQDTWHTKDRKQQTKVKPRKRKKNIDYKLFSNHKDIKALKQKEKYLVKKFEWPHTWHKIHTTQMKTNIKFKKNPQANLESVHIRVFYP
jgi:hypothetical protein